MWLWFTAQEDRCRHGRHGGAFPDQLCILPEEVAPTGGMSIQVQRKVTTNVQTGAWNTKTPDLHANISTTAAEASKLACVHCPWIKLSLGVWKGESISWLCSLSENSPCCHCAGNWQASEERVADSLGRKKGKGKMSGRLQSGYFLLDNFPSILFLIFYHCVRLVFFFTLTFFSKTKIKINVLLCWRMSL